ncbi:MAG TPA: methyltransferase domain-containing protein [Burkholderiaceae bacterium]|jgi:SAM-dependent methyltransferase|nr:methyltransferase domain-containing protein [Burkholderiaceae bacterium]
MYGDQPLADAKRFFRAFATNQLARVAPTLYTRATGETGRGDRTGETADGVAAYFKRCFDEYFAVLDVAPEAIDAWLAGRRLIEYGPGDIPGVALLMLSRGAQKVTCVDRFRLVSLSPFAVAVLRSLLSGLEGQTRDAALAAFKDPASLELGFREDKLEYLVTSSGLSGRKHDADLVYSRAVLEHVDDIAATFDDIAAALAPDGVSIHQVDLKSHGLHQVTPLDFLTWPASLWALMYSKKGVPNRWRINRYRDELARTGLRVDRLAPTGLYKDEDVRAVRSRLPSMFSGVSDPDLAWMGFWLVCRPAA